MNRYRLRQQQGSCSTKVSRTKADNLIGSGAEEVVRHSLHRHPLTVNDCLLLHRAGLAAVIIGMIALAFITTYQLASLEAALAALAV